MSRRTGDARDQLSNRELLFGRNVVREALSAARRTIYKLCIAEGIESDARLDEMRRRAEELGVPIVAKSRAEIDGWVRGHHQGVVLETGPFPYRASPDLDNLAATGACVLALDGVVDPGNLGALLRSADAAGFRHIVVPNDRAAGITPTVVHTAAGAIEHLYVWREVNLVRWMRLAKQAGFWIAGLAIGDGAMPLFDVELRPPIVLVVGSEGAGIRRLVREECDMLVEVPMVGHVASLNASVAGALAMYEVFRWVDTDNSPVSP